MGKEYMGMMRHTFVIDADGKLELIYLKVKAEAMADQILADLKLDATPGYSLTWGIPPSSTRASSTRSGQCMSGTSISSGAPQEPSQQTAAASPPVSRIRQPGSASRTCRAASSTAAASPSATRVASAWRVPWARGPTSPRVASPLLQHRQCGGGAAHGRQLQGRPGHQPSTGEAAPAVHPGQAEHGAGIDHQHWTGGLPRGLPARQGPVDAQPGWGSAQGHVPQMKAGGGRQTRLGRHRAHGGPRQGRNHRILRRRRVENPQAVDAGSVPAGISLSPVPAAVADQQPAVPAPGHGQMPSPIIPGRWMPHSWCSPPNRVARPLVVPSSGALVCQSPTVE